MKKNPLILGVGILSLVVLSIVSVLVLFLEDMIGETVATVGIGGIGAFATATLALATFWSMTQTEATLEDLERERKKPIKINLLAEVIEPALDKSSHNLSHLLYAEGWKVDSDSPRSSENRIRSPPSIRNVDSATWRELKENHPEVETKLKKWQNIYESFNQSGKNLIELLIESEEGGEIVDVRDIINLMGHKDEDKNAKRKEYYRQYYSEHPEVFHDYWRQKRVFYNYIYDMHDELIDIKREIQKEYGISNAEIAEYQPT